eukprot:7379738-Prymnesium_polylepis.1
MNVTRGHWNELLVWANACPTCTSPLTALYSTYSCTAVLDTPHISISYTSRHAAPFSPHLAPPDTAAAGSCDRATPSVAAHASCRSPSRGDSCRSTPHPPCTSSCSWCRG